MASEAKVRNQKTKLDKVTLTPLASKRVQHWLHQLKPHFTGKGIRRTELIEWILTNRKGDLSPKEIKKIKDRYHSEVHLAKWILDQVREAKTAGRQVQIKDLLTKETRPLKEPEKSNQQST